MQELIAEWEQAVKKRDSRRMDILIGEGMAIDEPCLQGMSALAQASHQEDCALMNVLIQKGANINQTCLGIPLLLQLLKANKIQAAYCLLRHYPDLHITDEQKKGPLHYSCEMGLADIVICLFKQREGALSSLSETGHTPLQLAVEKKHYPVIELFEEVREALSIDDQLLLKKQRIRVLSKSKNLEGFNQEQLFDAFEKRDYVYLENQFRTYPVINYFFYDKQSLLTISCERDDGKMIQFLLRNGADVNQWVKDRPLIQYVVFFSSFSTIQSLVEAGADINALCEFGNNCLHLSANLGREAETAYFLRNGGDANVENVRRLSPLDMAIKRGNRQLIKLFHDFQHLLSEKELQKLRQHRLRSLFE